MSASFYDLLKYAHTGIASPEMTAYDKMRALAMAGGGSIKTLTGVPPLSFKANGKPLISWSMKGNGQQNGTPASDNPIMPEFVGERTRNLFDGNTNFITDQNGNVYASNDVVSAIVDCRGINVIHVKIDSSLINSGVIRIGLSNDVIKVGSVVTRSQTSANASINVVNYNYALISCSMSGTPGSSKQKIMDSCMVNVGTTALSYEPYGYKLQITSAGQTQNVYLGQVQTTRRVKKLVLDGTENWSTQNVGPHRAVSIRKDELPLTPNMQVGTLNILSTHFKSIGDVTQLDVGKMASGSSYLNFDYDGINNVTNFKSFLAAQYSAGTPVTVWYVLDEPATAIVNEPLCKIGDYADRLDSEDAGVSIPTAKGQNTLTVDTELQPSSMTITYR